MATLVQSPVPFLVSIRDGDHASISILADLMEESGEYLATEYLRKFATDGATPDATSASMIVYHLGVYGVPLTRGERLTVLPWENTGVFLRLIVDYLRFRDHHDAAINVRQILHGVHLSFRRGAASRGINKERVLDRLFPGMKLCIGGGVLYANEPHQQHKLWKICQQR